MRRGWVLLAWAAIVLAAGMAGLEASAMPSVASPSLKVVNDEGCGDIVAAAFRGTISWDGSCSGAPEEQCGKVLH
jgi:hypothetical protein